MTGTWINVAAVLFGSSVGLLLGGRFPDRIRDTVMKGLGLLTLVIGLQMAFKTQNVLVLMGSILLGGIVGELLKIQNGLDRLGQFFQRRFGSTDGRGFSEGFVTASLVFCVGPMTSMGALQDGLTGDYDLLAVKSMLDLFASLGFAAVFGLGVMFATLTVLFVQGGISLGAGFLEGALNTVMIDEMTAAGGLMVLGIGFALLDLVHIRVANFLPALLIAPLLLILSTQLPF